MSITEQSSRPSSTDGEDASQGQTAGEIPDCSVVPISAVPKRITRRPSGLIYRSREERGWEGATYDEIGAVLGVTRQRVIQIEREALRKLRLAYENLMHVKQVNYKWEPGEDD